MAWLCLVPWFSTLTASKPLSQTWPLQILGLYSYGTRLCRTGQAPYAIWLASTKFQVQDTRNLDSMLIPSLSFKFTSKTSLKSGFCNACSLVYAQAVIWQVWKALQTFNQLVSIPAQHGPQWAGHCGQGPDRTGEGFGAQVLQAHWALWEALGQPWAANASWKHAGFFASCWII